MSSRKLSPIERNEYCVCSVLSFHVIEPLPATCPLELPGVNDRDRNELMLSARTNRKLASTPTTWLLSASSPVDWRDRKIAPMSLLRSTSRRARSTVKLSLGWPIVDSVWTVISPTPMPPARPVSRPPAAIGSGSPSRRQADAPAEEQQDLFFGRREPRVAQPRFARDVAEIEHPGVLEKELPLLRIEQAELRQVHLLLVGFGLREVGQHRDVERQRRRDAVLHVDARARVAVEASPPAHASRCPRPTASRAGCVPGPRPEARSSVPARLTRYRL